MFHLKVNVILQIKKNIYIYNNINLNQEKLQRFSKYPKYNEFEIFVDNVYTILRIFAYDKTQEKRKKNYFIFTILIISLRMDFIYSRTSYIFIIP